MATRTVSPYPAAKATGGKYYLNTGLLSAIGQDFVKAGRDMVARHIDEEQLRAAMNALQKQGYSLVADNFRTEAPRRHGDGHRSPESRPHAGLSERWRPRMSWDMSRPRSPQRSG